LRDADLKDKIVEAKAIGDVDFVAYQGEYEKMLKFEGADLKRLEERVDRLNARCPKGATNQPPLGEKSTKTGQYLVMLFDAHEDAEPTIVNEVRALVEKRNSEENLGLEIVEGHDKLEERTREKARLCYDGDYCCERQRPQCC